MYEVIVERWCNGAETCEVAVRTDSIEEARQYRKALADENRAACNVFVFINEGTEEA